MSQPATPPVSTPSANSTAGTLGLLLAGMGILVAAALHRLPAGTVERVLTQNRSWFFYAAVLVLLPVVGMGLGDWLRVRKRSYRPPSRRVQAARSALYGLLILSAQILAALGLRARPLAGLESLGWPALAPLPLAGAYALGAWWLLFKPRVFTAPQLSSFAAAADALLFTNDFLIGKRGGEWNTLEGDSAWERIPELAMFTNIYCLGGIGSGKTHTVVKPLLEQALFKWPGDSEVDYRTPEGRTVKVSARRMRNALFILDAAKGNMTLDLIIPRARAAGRLNDVLVISPAGVQALGRELTDDERALQERLVSFNPLANGSPQALAVRLVSALTVMSAQEPHSYYLKMQTEFASNAFAILHETLGAGRYTLLDLWRFVCEEDFQKSLLEEARPGNSIAYRWFSQQWAKEDPRERMMLTKGFRADLSQFVTDEMRPTFCQAEATFPGWKCLTEEGRTVVFNMNPNRWGSLARALGVFLMMDFQDFMLARSTPAFKLAGGNNNRLVLCLADEAWFYMNEKWAEFTSVSREARCCTIALHQGLAQIPEKYRPTMLGNHRTWVMLAVNDSLTTQTLSAELGTYQTVRASRSEASGYAGVERGLLADDMTAKAGGESRSISVSYSDVELPRFTPDAIQSLAKWTAVVRIFDGDQLRPPRVVSLLPGHLNKLG
jgi:hypothetical protein